MSPGAREQQGGAAMVCAAWQGCQLGARRGGSGCWPNSSLSLTLCRQHRARRPCCSRHRCWMQPGSKLSSRCDVHCFAAAAVMQRPLRAHRCGHWQQHCLHTRSRADVTLRLRDTASVVLAVGCVASAGRMGVGAANFPARIGAAGADLAGKFLHPRHARPKLMRRTNSLFSAAEH